MTSRLERRLDRVYAIGGGPGANRPALTDAEQEAHDLVARWMRDAGLDVTVDPVGNLWGRRPGEVHGPEIWTGSHLDSVPRGGRLDGVLGVLAALEAVSRLDGRPRRPVAVVAFRDEEGWRFRQGFLGSRALTGRLPADALEARDDDGVSVREALARLGLNRDPPPTGWVRRPPAAYVEVHVEQGPRLAAADAPLGVVTAIAGLAGYEVVVEASGGHAGTVPMATRHDALVDAAAFVLAVARAAAAVPDAVGTVGIVHVEPGASNVIPRRVRLTVDVRAPDAPRLDEVCARVEDLAGGRARRLWRQEPATMDAALQERLARAAAAVGAATLRLPSGAGHDAGVLAAAGIPAAMLFVRSRAGGVSHSPDEASDPDDVELAVATLAAALDDLSALAGR